MWYLLGGFLKDLSSTYTSPGAMDFLHLEHVWGTLAVLTVYT